MSERELCGRWEPDKEDSITPSVAHSEPDPLKLDSRVDESYVWTREGLDSAN